MANERNELTRVNWGELFAFTRVFKSGSLARNVSTLGLALAAIFLVCATGWVLDSIASLTGQTVLDGTMGTLREPAGAPGGADAEAAMAIQFGEVSFSEIEDYARLSPGQFAASKKAFLDARPQAAAKLRGVTIDEARSFSRFLLSMGNTEAKGRDLHKALVEIVAEKTKDDKAQDRPKPVDLLKEAKADWSAEVDKAQRDALKYIEDLEELVAKAHEKAEKNISGKSGDSRDEAQADLAADYKTALREVTARRAAVHQQVRSIRGKNIFDTLVVYEGKHLKRAICALLSGNISSGLSGHLSQDQAGARANLPAEEPGFIVEVLLVVAGVKWLFVEHWLYGTLLVLASLAIWAMLGGAMHRVAALQAGREEKISLFEAIRFARSRFLSFFCAPLMPLAFVVLLGVLLMLGGLLTNIPWIGPFLVGALFIFALLLGLAIAFLLIGLLGGGGLMYPTIAVEGSDCFDAMSRSFTYVFSRPWRAGLYAAAAVVHGAICYVFVRFFAFLALASTHWFAKAAVWTGGQTLPTTVASNPDKMDVLWTAPTFSTLHTWNWEAMTAAQGFGAVLVMAWVYVVVGLVAAFALSYFVGSMTMIYYLLRREVDATEFDEVYISEEEDEPLPPVEPEPEGDLMLTATEEAPAEEATEDAPPEDEAPVEEPAEEEAPDEDEAATEEADEAPQDDDEADQGGDEEEKDGN